MIDTQVTVMPFTPATVRPADFTAMSESATLLNAITAAASNPAVDIDKMIRLLEMHDKIKAQAAERAFNAAMSMAESEMRSVVTDKKNSQTNSRYASYEAIDRDVRPAYTKHGFSLTFDTEAIDATNILVKCRVAHDDGHSRLYSIPMPADGKGARGGDVMTRTHATGSAISYGMRYLLKMIFNIATGDGWGDDDGKAASVGAPADELPASVRAYLEIALGKIEEIETAQELTAWWAAEKAQRTALDICNSASKGPVNGYAQLFGAFSARGKALSMGSRA